MQRISRTDRAAGLAGERAWGEADFPAAQRMGKGLQGLLSVCSNPGCTSGWLHLWRSRKAPVFEGGWNCSPGCTAARLEAAVRREMGGRGNGWDTETYAGAGVASNVEMTLAGHRHRVPLGLVMLEQGWITATQLRQALEEQRAAGHGKLGTWLIRQHGISEQLVTRALGLQWSCPVLPLTHHDPDAMTPALPRLFIEAFGALPLRVAAGKILYLGFSGRLDPVVTLALERMLGLRVETGLVCDSLFEPALERMLEAVFPRTEIIEARSQAPLLRVLTKALERAKPIESRLVRVHDCLWLRMWLRPQEKALPEISGVEDVICSLSSH